MIRLSHNFEREKTMKEYILEIKQSNSEEAIFNTEHDSDAQAIEHLNETIALLIDRLNFKLDYYEFYRVEDNNRVVIDENYFV